MLFISFVVADTMLCLSPVLALALHSSTARAFDDAYDSKGLASARRKIRTIQGIGHP